MIDIKKIDEAYKLYGFEVLDVEGVKVYIYTQGRYFGVDIFDTNTLIRPKRSENHTQF